MRNLASVVTIKDFDKMFEKDRIVCARMNENAYEVIIPASNSVPNTKMIFIQEGSILPETPNWEFLRKRCYNESLKGFVIKPMTMGKKEAKDENGNPCKGDSVKSWGLAVGLNESGLSDKVIKDLKAGDDVTELLNIRKYEPEEDVSPKKESKVPGWVKFCFSHAITRWIGNLWKKFHKAEVSGFPTDVIEKSDETTIQNAQRYLSQFKDELVYVTAKLEGQSVTALFDYKNDEIGKFYVCSRNNAYKTKNSSIFWAVAEKLNIEEKLRKYYAETGKLLVIQAEQVGPNIQENIYNLKENNWYVYTMKDIITGEALDYESMRQACNVMGLNMVPTIVKNIKLNLIMPDIKSAVEFAENQYWTVTKDRVDWSYSPNSKEAPWKNYMQHEGIVVRSMNCDKKRNIGVSFKVKNLQYQERGLKKMHEDCVKIESSLK